MMLRTIEDRPERAPESDTRPTSLALRRLIGRLRLRHLDLLDLLGRDPNIGRAALRMNLTQPTVSKLLIEIESIFGVPLFVRNRRGLSPTPAGLAMTRRSGLLLEELRATQEELDATLRGATSRARIGVFPVAVPDLLVGIREQLPALAPGMVLSVEEGVEHQLIAALLAGRIDCILGRIVPEQLSAEIRHEVLLREPTVIVSGARHPIVRTRGRARMALLAQSQWLLPAPGGAVYNMVASRLALENLPAPQVVIETTSVFVTIELLNRSNLLAILPRNVALSYQKAGKLAIAPIAMPDTRYPLGIMFRRDAATTRLVRTLIEAAREAAGAIAARDPSGAAPGARRVSARSLPAASA